LIFAELFHRIARLFSVSFCSSRIAGKALRESQREPKKVPLPLRSKVELSLSGLQQSNGLAEIPFKCQLGDLTRKSRGRRSLCVYLRQQFSGFLQVTLGQVDAGLFCHQIGIVWDNVQRPIAELSRSWELSNHAVGLCVSHRRAVNIAPLQLGQEVRRVHSARLDEALVTAALYIYARDLKSACNVKTTGKGAAGPREASQVYL
jgi:hypothetical protein